METSHFENPPRFQFLYCLKNEVEGGRSTFVDGYAAAEVLLASNPVHFRTLLNHRIPFEYLNAGHHTYHDHPTFELRPDISSEELLSGSPKALVNCLHAINYAPPFQGPLENHDPDEQRALLEALRAFDRICGQEAFRFEILLQPGQCVGFDNRRVLHARTAFKACSAVGRRISDASSSSVETKRWLRGYVSCF